MFNGSKGFRQWLDLVKELLGAKAYGHWLEEIRDITVSSKAFQQWLPSSNITKLLNSNQSSASPKHHNVNFCFCFVLIIAFDKDENFLFLRILQWILLNGYLLVINQ